ncbi:MAG: TRAP transporter substrate-binding protein [Candidatus Aerophobetes bacterium]|nr:TRAP transporter substrate-binding protein [Candidatus Aerophobetes bacterium]
MRRKKLKIVWITVLIAGIIIVGIGNINSKAKGIEPMVLKLGHVVPTSHPYHLGAVKFKELIEKRTKGKIKIEIYPAGQLTPGERSLIEQMQLGLCDLTVTATGPVSGFMENMMVVDLPFLFRSYEHAHNVLDGIVGDELLEQLKEVGIKGLAFWENGFRNITNSVRPINSVNDLRGLKIRTMENPVHLDSFKDLGANPTPMSWPIYTELQTGVIDGQENPLPIIYAYKFWEVQKYLAISEHFYSPAPILMNLKRYNSLPLETQKIFLSTAKEVAHYERALIKEQEKKYTKIMKKYFKEVTYPPRKEFREAVEPVYNKWLSRHSDWKRWIEIIKETEQE